ncbi:MAG: hypothetical protein QW393_00665 [Candidatus Micrarchaeaceae archaeon]
MESKTPALGIGLILLGIAIYIVWLLLQESVVCSCPMIPANATPAQIHSICHCSSDFLLLYLGLFAIFAGFLVLLFNDRVDAAHKKTKR